MYANEPVNEDGSHIFIDIALHTHVKAIRLSKLLSRLHILLNVVAVKAHVVDVSDCCPIDFVNSGVDALLDSLLVYLQLVVHANCGQFVAGAQA